MKELINVKISIKDNLTFETKDGEYNVTDEMSDELISATSRAIKNILDLNLDNFCNEIIGEYQNTLPENMKSLKDILNVDVNDRVSNLLHKESYEFGKNVLRIDIVPEVSKDDELLNNPCIIIMGGDEGNDVKGNEQGHNIKDIIEFNDLENLNMFQQGLELMQKAIMQENE